MAILYRHILGGFAIAAAMRVTYNFKINLDFDQARSSRVSMGRSPNLKEVQPRIDNNKHGPSLVQQKVQQVIFFEQFFKTSG